MKDFHLPVNFLSILMSKFLKHKSNENTIMIYINDEVNY